MNPRGRIHALLIQSSLTSKARSKTSVVPPLPSCTVLSLSVHFFLLRGD